MTMIQGEQKKYHNAQTIGNAKIVIVIPVMGMLIPHIGGGQLEA